MRRSGRQTKPPQRYEPEESLSEGEETEDSGDMYTSEDEGGLTDTTGSLASFIAEDSETDALEEYRAFLRSLTFGCDENKVEQLLQAIEAGTVDRTLFSGLVRSLDHIGDETA